MVPVPATGRSRPGWAGSLPELDESQLERWATLFAERTGMDLSGRWAPALGAGVRSRMRETGFDSYDAYFHFVTARNGAMEWTALVDRLAIHDTGFFRDTPGLALVRKHVQQEQSPEKTVKLWSVGCASGEEPYTLAMIAACVLESEAVSRYFGVVATDISLANVEYGRRGMYGSDRLKSVPGDMRARYFEEVCEGYHQVVREIRDRVCFAQLNVLEAGKSPLGQMDVIFCQDVLPYFSEQQRGKITALLAGWLNVGGLLVLGAGELPDWSMDGMERIRQPETLAFRRNA